MPVISVSDLCKYYRVYRKPAGLRAALGHLVRREWTDLRAVDNLSFQIEEGDMVGFLGPNGAGKTTTLKMLSGLLHPTGGTLDVAGYIPFRREPSFLRQIALVAGQKNQLWWDLPPADSFALNREIYEVPDAVFRSTLSELVDVLEIGDALHVQVRRLSLGQRMKCELAAALLHRPRVLFLDEPTIGLDVVVQKRLRAFLKEYNRRHGTTILLTSHDMDDVEELCRRVMVINHGRLVFDGDVSGMVERFAATKYIAVVFAQPVERAELEEFGTLIAYEGGLAATLAVPREGHSRRAAALLNRYAVDDLDIRDPGLEDVIAQVFGAGPADMPVPAATGQEGC